MTNTNFNALNFSYLLLDFYKEMNLSEKELAVILMISHLLEQGNEFVTNDLLSLKMNMSSKEIDLCMTNLYKKKYIEFDMNGEKPTTSIQPIKKIVCKKFEKSLFSEEEIKENAELSERREYVFKMFTDTFARELTPIELSHIDDWLKNGVSTEIIINSLKDAKAARKFSIQYIDTLVIKKSEENNQL